MTKEQSQTMLICKTAKAALNEVRALTDEKISLGLFAAADALISEADAILEANKKDIAAARGIISDVMIDRLKLTRDRIEAMAKGVRDIAALPSPLGCVLEEGVRPNGLLIQKVSVPIGVIAIIYESRPNVTSDAAALALKSGNVSILKSGKEAYNTSAAITKAMKKGLRLAGICENAVNLVSDTSRAAAHELMKASGYVDLLIPRGGAGLIRACVENATVPCLETGTGICHIYVDKDADIEKALKIVNNAKTSRPSVCNAAEVLLVHRDAAEDFLPKIARLMREDRQAAGLIPVELRADAEALRFIDATAAALSDFDTEFLDYIMAVKVVGDIEEAAEHIALHSTHHSEAIITENEAAAKFFTDSVDSAAVYVNASTRFTDGGEFGLGCEMGISTQKMHARGPLGIRELTTYKYIIRGNGQIR